MPRDDTGPGFRAARPQRVFVLPWWVLVGGTTLLLLAYTSPWMKMYFLGLYRFKARVFWTLLLGSLLLATVPIQEYAEHNLVSQRFSFRYGRLSRRARLPDAPGGGLLRADLHGGLLALIRADRWSRAGRRGIGGGASAAAGSRLESSRSGNDQENR